MANHTEQSNGPSTSKRARRSTLIDEKWDCGLCTYKNNADSFKCVMCDVRRGTSTRPSVNKDNVVAEVVRQQEQIRQKVVQTTKPALVDECSSSSTATSSSSSTASISPAKVPISKKKPSSPIKSLPIAIKSSSTTNSLGSNFFTYEPPIPHKKSDLHINKKKTTTSTITVNDVTITITEFATKKTQTVRNSDQIKKSISTDEASKNSPLTARIPESTNNNTGSGKNETRRNEDDLERPPQPSLLPLPPSRWTD